MARPIAPEYRRQYFQPPGGRLWDWRARQQRTSPCTTQGRGGNDNSGGRLLSGAMTRWSNTLFMHWRSRQKKPRHKTTTGFFSTLNAEHHPHAIRCLHARQPGFQPAS